MGSENEWRESKGVIIIYLCNSFAYDCLIIQYGRGSAMKRIGILTGGGDAPGLNAVIRAAVKTAIQEYGCEVLGIRDGYDGFLLEDGIIPLGVEAVRGILPRGG